MSKTKTRTKDKYRVVYNDTQRIELENEFRLNEYIAIPRKQEIAQRLQLSERQIKIWFQNRRAKKRKQQKRKQSAVSTTTSATANSSPTSSSISPSISSSTISHKSSICEYTTPDQVTSITSPAKPPPPQQQHPPHGRVTSGCTHLQPHQPDQAHLYYVDHHQGHPLNHQHHHHPLNHHHHQGQQQQQQQQQQLTQSLYQVHPHYQQNGANINMAQQQLQQQQQSSPALVQHSMTPQQQQQHQQQHSLISAADHYTAAAYEIVPSAGTDGPPPTCDHMQHQHQMNRQLFHSHSQQLHSSGNNNNYTSNAYRHSNFPIHNSTNSLADNPYYFNYDSTASEAVTSTNVIHNGNPIGKQTIYH